MTDFIQAVKGMNDILPVDMPYWHHLENQLRALAKSYGYQEIRTPIIEKTQLFKRTIGEVTDIVEKEMYTFSDRNQESLTMRPEGTAGVVRAGIEQGLFYNQIQRLWYLGPNFRYERPQKGRYRQFYQFGLEAVGMASAEIDAEVILFNARLWQQLGLADNIKLQLNTLGSSQSRAEYRKVLIKYFEAHLSQLDEDSQRRLHTNPLRILDSKNSDMFDLIQGAPVLTDYLEESSQQHFARLQDLLKNADVEFTVNPRLVRGLDYYTDTVFEWITDELGAQGTVSAGGRYDGLIKQLGGQETPAVGFAMGLERIVELLKQQSKETESIVDVYFILLGETALTKGMMLAEQLRTEKPQLKIQTHLAGGGMKSQFKKADKSGAKIALIIGEEEVNQGVVSIKYLRDKKEQETIKEVKLIKVIENIF